MLPMGSGGSATLWVSLATSYLLQRSRVLVRRPDDHAKAKSDLRLFSWNRWLQTRPDRYASARAIYSRSASRVLSKANSSHGISSGAKVAASSVSSMALSCPPTTRTR